MSDLMERLKFYLRSCADPTHGYIEDLDKLEAEVARLTDENAALIASADRLMNMRIELENIRAAQDKGDEK